MEALAAAEGGGAFFTEEKPHLDVGWRPLWELIRDGVTDLARRHWDEVGWRKNELPLHVDWEAMKRSEQLETFRAIGAYCQDKLVGYNAFVITKSFHYQMRHAMNDAIFVDPEYANAGVGAMLVKSAEFELKMMGLGQPTRILYHVKHGLPPERDLGRLLEKLGYEGFQTHFDKIVRP